MTNITSLLPLSHLRVLDLTRARAGPTCCRILADFGADVLKIEAPPGVDPNEDISGSRHGYDMINLHRNKRSLTLNLKEPEGRVIFMRCPASAGMTSTSSRSEPNGAPRRIGRSGSVMLTTPIRSSRPM